MYAFRLFVVMCALNFVFMACETDPVMERWPGCHGPDGVEYPQFKRFCGPWQVLDADEPPQKSSEKVAHYLDNIFHKGVNLAVSQWRPDELIMEIPAVPSSWPPVEMNHPTLQAVSTDQPLWAGKYWWCVPYEVEVDLQTWNKAGECFGETVHHKGSIQEDVWCRAHVVVEACLIVKVFDDAMIEELYPRALLPGAAFSDGDKPPDFQQTKLDWYSCANSVGTPCLTMTVTVFVKYPKGLETYMQWEGYKPDPVLTNDLNLHSGTVVASDEHYHFRLTPNGW